MKKKILIYTVCILIIALIQVTLLNYIKIFNVKPNLFIVFVIIAAFFRGSYEGAVIGFFAGITQDMVSGKVLGFYAILGLYLGLIVGSINKRLHRENLILNILNTFLFSFLYESVLFVILKWSPLLIGKNSLIGINVLDALKRIILPEAVYNSIISIVVFIIFIKINDKLETESKAARKY